MFRLKAAENTLNKNFANRYQEYLFICGGAFDGLEKIIEKRTSNSTLGFPKQRRQKSKKLMKMNGIKM